MKAKSFLLIFLCSSSLTLVSSERKRSDEDLVESARAGFLRASKRLMSAVAASTIRITDYPERLYSLREEVGKELTDIEPMNVRVQDGEILATPELISASSVFRSFAELVLHVTKDRTLDLVSYETVNRQTILDLNQVSREDVKHLVKNITDRNSARALADLLLVMRFWDLDSNYVNKIQFDHGAFYRFFKEIASEYSDANVNLIKKYLGSCRVFDLKDAKVRELPYGSIYSVSEGKLFGSFEIERDDEKETGLAYIDLNTGKVKFIAYGNFHTLFKIDDSTFLVYQGFNPKKITISEGGISSMVDFPKFEYVFKNSTNDLVVFNGTTFIGDSSNRNILIYDIDGKLKSKYKLDWPVSVAQLDKNTYIYVSQSRGYIQKIRAVGGSFSKPKYIKTLDFTGDRIDMIILTGNNILYFESGKDLNIFNIALKRSEEINLDLGRYYQIFNIDESHFMVIGEKGIKMVTYILEDKRVKIQNIETVLNINLIKSYASPDGKYCYVVPVSGDKIIQIPLVAGVSCDLEQEKQAAATSADA